MTHIACKSKLSPFHTNWRRLAMHWRPTILDTSPMHRQTTSVRCHHIASRRQRFVKLGDFFGMFKKIAKPRQRSPVNKASSIGRQRHANHRQATPAACQYVVNRSSVFLGLQRWISIDILIGNIEIILNCQNYTWRFDKWTLSLSMHGIQKKLKEERRKIKYQHIILVLWI